MGKEKFKKENCPKIDVFIDSKKCPKKSAPTDSGFFAKYWGHFVAYTGVAALFSFLGYFVQSKRAPAQDISSTNSKYLVGSALAGAAAMYGVNRFLLSDSEELDGRPSGSSSTHP